MARVSPAMVVLALVMLPAQANAASATVSDGTLRVQSGAAPEVLRVVPSGGAYLVQSDAQNPRPQPGAGCARTKPHELRCSGRIDALDVRLGSARSNSFQTWGLTIPLSVTGGDGADGILIGRMSPFASAGSGPVSIDGGAGRDSITIIGQAGVSYVADGGAGNDTLQAEHRLEGPPPSVTFRGGDGKDTLTGDTGADELDGGAGSDSLSGSGGGDTLSGGPGTDTVLFAPQQDAPVDVTLDGQRNDGAAGDNALVGSDVENVTLKTPNDGGPVFGRSTVIGDDRPNVLIGAGIVRGLGGDDVISSAGAGVNDLDGGDGNDRISARVYDDFTQYVIADRITCGNGDDVLFTDGRDPHPADCERFNLGLHVSAATAPVGPGGQAAVRVTCADTVPCRLGALTLKYKKHLANEYTGHSGPAIAPGHSVVYRVRLNRWLRRPGRFRTLVVTAMPEGTAGGLYAGIPRVIKLIRSA